MSGADGWTRHPQTGRDICDTWTNGDFVLRCNIRYSSGDCRGWILEHKDRIPLENEGAIGLMLAFWDITGTSPPLEKATEILESIRPVTTPKDMIDWHDGQDFGNKPSVLTYNPEGDER